MKIPVLTTGQKLAIGLSIAAGIIGIVAYFENRKTNKMNRELIALSLEQKKRELGLIP